MIRTRTPLRVSFVGGGTDFPDFYRQFGGEVISTAISQEIEVRVWARGDGRIRIDGSIKEMASALEQVRHDRIREALRVTGVVGGVTLRVDSPISAQGSGLGSSSAVTVGVLQGLSALKGIDKSAEELAQNACEIEMERLGDPIGKQDQYIAAYGGLRHLKFHPDESVQVESVPLSEATRRKLNTNLLLFYTGIERKSSDILREQRQRTTANFDRLLELKSLVSQVKGVLGDPGRLDELGALLHRGWELKQQLAHQISGPHLNRIYATARKAGALGGKLLGAGGGGFFLFYAPPRAHPAIRAAMRGLQELPFRLGRDGSRILCQSPLMAPPRQKTAGGSWTWQTNGETIAHVQSGDPYPTDYLSDAAPHRQ